MCLASRFWPSWVVLVGLAISPGRSAGQPPLEEILHGYESQLNPLMKATVQVSSAYHEAAADLPGGEAGLRFSATFHRDNDRWRVMESVKFQRKVNADKLELRKSACQYTFVDGSLVQAFVNPETNRLEGAASVNGPASGQEEFFLSLHQYYGAVLFYQVMPLDMSTGLADVLRRSEATTRFEAVDGRQLVRADASGPWGWYSVWFDPGLGYQVRRAVQSKRETDLVRPDKTLRAWRTIGDRYCTAAEASVEMEQFREVDGKHIPTRFVVKEKSRWGGKNSSTHEHRTVVTVDDIQPNPRFPKGMFSLSDVIPNGTEVTLQDERPITYEWEDGRIEKAVNRSSLERLAGNPFRRGSWLSRGLMILIVLCAVAGGYWLVRRRRAGAGV